MREIAARPVLRIAAVLLAALTTTAQAGQAPGIDGLLAQLGEAPPEELRTLGARIQADRPGLAPADADRLLDALAVAWYRHGRFVEALATFDDLLATSPGSSGLTYLKIAQIHRDRLDEEREVAALLASVREQRVDTHRDVMDADNTANIAYRRLGEIHEARQQWARALAFWERWEPTSWCGNGMVSFRHQRQMAIARCRSRLKDDDGALQAVWQLVSETDCLNGVHPEAAVLYAELADRAGRLVEANRSVRRLPRDRRERFLVPIAVRRAHREADPDGILNALGHFQAADFNLLEYGQPLEARVAAELLDNLGEPARRVLAARIDTLDFRAIAVAGLSGEREHMPALRALAAREGVDEITARIVQNALTALDRNPKD